jgi:hypothetical protein
VTKSQDISGLGQRAVDEKSNEITAVLELLEKIQIKGQLPSILFQNNTSIPIKKAGFSSGSCFPEFCVSVFENIFLY